MLAVANRLKCEVHFATSALTKPSFQPLKILYIQQAFFVSTDRHLCHVELLCLTHLTGGTNKEVMSNKLAGKKPSLRSLAR